MIANLLSNAIKYSPNGGTITVAADVQDGVVRVSVSDNGIGIPSDQQHRVFAKFFRADSSSSGIKGVGLGLSLCREIVHAHGGALGFDSAYGQGSTFWFELRDDAAPRPEPHELTQMGDIAPLGRCKPSAMRRTQRFSRAFGVDAAADAPSSARRVGCGSRGRAPRSSVPSAPSRCSPSSSPSSRVPPTAANSRRGTHRGRWNSAASRMAESADRCQDSDMPPTVLIVDDHPSFRATARALLEAEGFDVIGEAEDGETALEACRAAPPGGRPARRAAAGHRRLRGRARG